MTFQDFQAYGCLAIQYATSLIVSHNNDRHTMPVALGRSVVKAGVNFGTSATSLNSQLPAALMVTVPRKASSNVVVIPPAGAPATSAQTRILGVTA